MLESLQSKIMAAIVAVVFISYLISFAQGWVKIETPFVVGIAVAIGLIGFFLTWKIDQHYSFTDALANIDEFRRKSKVGLATGARVNWFFKKRYRGQTWMIELKNKDGSVDRLDIDTNSRQPVAGAFDVDKQVAPFLSFKLEDYLPTYEQQQDLTRKIIKDKEDKT